MSDRPSWDNQFRETEDERNERLATARKRRAAENKAKGAYSQWCRDPSLCAGKGYCPRDPTCGD
jgi:hypothetical protein